MSTPLLQDRYVKVGDVNTRYWQAGDKGSVVVLVHGLGGFIENWERNIDALAQRHRVYALDLLGFGRTDKLPLVKDVNVLVKFLADFLVTQNIDRASFIGNSLGGGLVLAFALEHPGMVEKLVLVDNAGMGRDVIPDFKFCSLPLVGELFLRPSRKSTEKLWEKLVYDPSKVTPEIRDLGYRYISSAGAKKTFLATTRAGINLFGQKDKLTRQLLAGLKDLKAPVLVVWGTDDRIIPVAHARIALEKIPGARLELFEKCGHMPMLECPDKFNKLVLNFLAGR